MSTIITRKKIITTSRELFYKHGIANTRLQQIADGCEISIGNLAYHYKNKEAIVEAVYENVINELETLVKNASNRQELNYFDRFFDSTYKFIVANIFCFNNVWEINRNYPKIKSKWKKITNTVVSSLEDLINELVNKKILKTEPHEGYYQLLAQNILINIEFWIPQQVLKGKSVNPKLFKIALWNLIYPNLTESGLLEYANLEQKKQII